MSDSNNKENPIEEVARKAAKAYCELNFPNGAPLDITCAEMDFTAGFITAVDRYEKKAMHLLKGLEGIERIANKYGETYVLAEIRYMIAKIRGGK